MLTADQNRLLTDVSAGSPLNAYWKRHWIPAIRSEALKIDGTPTRVELLCERLVAFRTTDGSVGFLNEACPHRGASLAMGRNENNRLTCLFHGWNFNANGECEHMPTEKTNGLCAKVPGNGYPVREGGGIVWVYLGPGEPPQFTDYQFTHLSAEHARPRASYNRANWLQNVETLLDSAHIGLLHADTVKNRAIPQAGLQLAAASDTPKYSFESKPYGLRSFAERPLPDGSTYLRVTEYVAPGTAFIGTTDAEAGFLIIVVPVNNTKSLQWYIYWDERQEINDNLPDFALLGTDESDDDFAASRSGLDRFGQDREAMRRGETWSGVPGVIFEDYAIAESIPIVDRTKEFLGSGDVAIVKMRRELMARIAQSYDGEKIPEELCEIDYRALRALASIIPPGTDINAFADEQQASRRGAFTLSPNLSRGRSV
jgi:phthalate 4,5-dioxygenase oxygenase subunit